MTKDKIILMAREAGFERLGTYASFGEDWVAFTESLEAFAKLVLMNTDPNSFMSYQEGAEAGRLAEREACAKMCESYTDKSDSDHESHGYACAIAIRARS